MNAYYLGLIATYGINVLCALSVYVIMKSGQISVGNAGFMALGAYTAAILTTKCGMNSFLAILLGGIFASVFGMLIGIPALKLKGTYLVICTISFTSMIRSIVQVLTITGGAMGYKGISRIDVKLIFVFVFIAILALLYFEKTSYGLFVLAVSSNEQASYSSGINVVLVKVISFTVGALLAGIAGGCYAHWAQYIEPSDFSTSLSTMMVLPVVLGGRKNIFGAVLGALVFTILPEILRFTSVWRMVIYGILVIFIVIVKPDGLISKGVRHVRS